MTWFFVTESLVLNIIAKTEHASTELMTSLALVILDLDPVLFEIVKTRYYRGEISSRNFRPQNYWIGCFFLAKIVIGTRFFGGWGELSYHVIIRVLTLTVWQHSGTSFDQPLGVPSWRERAKNLQHLARIRLENEDHWSAEKYIQLSQYLIFRGIEMILSQRFW